MKQYYGKIISNVEKISIFFDQDKTAKTILKPLTAEKNTDTNETWKNTKIPNQSSIIMETPH